MPWGVRTSGLAPIKITFKRFKTEFTDDAVFIVEKENFEEVPSAVAWTCVDQGRLHTSCSEYSKRYWGPCVDSSFSSLRCSSQINTWHTAVTSTPFTWESDLKDNGGGMLNVYVHFQSAYFTSCQANDRQNEGWEAKVELNLDALAAPCAYPTPPPLSPAELLCAQR